MSNFNTVDYVILAIFLVSTFAGLYRGALREVLAILTWLAAFLIAGLFASHVAGYFAGTEHMQAIADSASGSMGGDSSQQISMLALGASFVGLFLLSLIVGSLISTLVNKIVQGSAIGLTNRFLGAIFGVGRGYLVNLLLIFLLQLAPQMQDNDWWNHSVLIPMFQPSVQLLENVMSPQLDQIKAKMGKTLGNEN